MGAPEPTRALGVIFITRETRWRFPLLTLLQHLLLWNLPIRLEQFMTIGLQRLTRLRIRVISVPLMTGLLFSRWVVLRKLPPPLHTTRRLKV